MTTVAVTIATIANTAGGEPFGGTVVTSRKRSRATNGVNQAPFVRVREAGLRHNPCMPPNRALVLIAVLSLVGCDAGKPFAGPAANKSAPVSILTNGMEFTGERDCVDCDGIESWLRLEQAGKARRYRMVEVYSGQDHERRFEDSGDWSTDGDLLRLHSSQGGVRVYVRTQVGYLQARGANGQRIAAIEGDVLEPAGFDSTR